MPNLLIPELWKGQCAEWAPALPGVALRADSAGSCLLQFQQALPASSLDLTLRLTKGAACSNHAVLLTTATAGVSLREPFGPQDTGVMFRWDCDRKVLVSSSGDGSSSSTVCSRQRDYEVRLSLGRSRAVFADDFCDELSAPLSLDPRPLHLYLGVDCAPAAERGGAARDACGSRTAFSFAEIREPCDAAMCGEHGKPEGSRLFSSPSRRGCSCRCADGFGGQFCEVPQHGQSASLARAPVPLQGAPGSSATASAARASRLQNRPFHCLSPSRYMQKLAYKYRQVRSGRE